MAKKKTVEKEKRTPMTEIESDKTIDAYARLYHENPVGFGGSFTQDYIKFANKYIKELRKKHQRK